MMTNQMGEYKIKFVVELTIYISVSVASVCLHFPYKKQHSLYRVILPTFAHLCQTNMHAARILQQSWTL